MGTSLLPSDKRRRRKGGRVVKPNKRLDIQGLRAIAVLLVILNHAGVPGLEGGYIGVDVFFVVSGFVITKSLLRPGRRHISLTDFYGARARRILPMATLVALITMIASYLVMNYVRAQDVWRDGIWASFYLINFHLGTQGTDYFSAELPPSPLQHYWSLAVEEQFYIVWPILLGLLIFGDKFKSPASEPAPKIPTNRIGMALVAIIAASLTWSVIQTSQSPTLAYFSSLTRGWELALGGLLAVYLHKIELVPPAIKAAAAWVGIGCILAAAVLFTAATQFPGYAVALPVVGTALVIAGGTSGPSYGPVSFLKLPPMQYVGDISYSLYLWHWPVLILAEAYAGHELSLTTNLILIVGAFGLSALSYQFFENPIRELEGLKTDKWMSLFLWLISWVLVLALAVFMRGSLTAAALQANIPAPATATATAAANAVPAGATLSDDPFAAAVRDAVAAAKADTPIPTGLSPSPARLANDVDTLSGCSAADGDVSNPICTYGDPDSPRSLVIIGDSHTLMWVPALDAIGKEHGWKVTPLVKHNCTAAAVTLYDETKGPNTECDTWRDWATQQALGLKPDRIIVSTRLPDWVVTPGGGKTNLANDIAPIWSQGIKDNVETLMSTKIPVTVLSDAPGIVEDPVECVLARNATMGSCTSDMMKKASVLNPAMKAGATAAGAEFVDITDWFCASNKCPVVIGTTISYRDHGHVSKTYALQLAEPLAIRLGLV